MPANGCSACDVLPGYDNGYEHSELPQINERYGTRPYSPLDFGTCSSFLGSLGRGLRFASRHANSSHLVRSDSKDDCGNQSPRCCSPCDCLARSILFWSETFDPYPTIINPWYRSCTPPSIFAGTSYSSLTLERSAQNGTGDLWHILAGTHCPQLCTTAFLSEVSQYIKLGDLTAESYAKTNDLVDSPARDEMAIGGNAFIIESCPAGIEPGMEGTLSREEEDTLLKVSTGDLPDWTANFIRRVILLLENLPDEDSSGNADGATEGKAHYTYARHLAQQPSFSPSYRCGLWRLQPDLRSPFG